MNILIEKLFNPNVDELDARFKGIVPSSHELDDALSKVGIEFVYGNSYLEGARVRFAKFVDIRSQGKFSSFISLQGMSIWDYAQGNYSRRQDKSKNKYTTYTVIYTLGGKGYLEFDEKRHELLPGDGFIINGTLPHKYGTNEHTSWTYASLHLGGEALHQLHTELTNQTAILFSFASSSHFYTSLQQVFDIYLGDKNNLEEKTLALLNIILGEIILTVSSNITQSGVPPIYIKIKRFLDTHYSQKISLDGLSKKFNVSKYHLVREFKKYFNLTPIDYLIQQRLLITKELLSHSNYSIQKICSCVGISSQTLLYHLFEKKFGMSPSEFKAENQSHKK